MGYIRIVLKDSNGLDDIKEQFSEFEDFWVDSDNFFNPEDTTVNITFYGEEEDISEKYADICKKNPKIKIDMSYDDGEGYITYYENEDGWGHRCWIEEYDVEEE